MAVNRRIPGTYVTINDGNLVFNSDSNNPNVFVLGTAAAGPSYTPVKVGSYQQIRGALYGDEGSLVDGLHLLQTTAAQSVFAVRINSKASVLQGIGGASHKIQTVLQDASAGTNYKVAYDSSAQRLQIVNELNTIVYDNGSTPTIDLGEVIVRPIYTNTTVDIGTIGSVWISMDELGDGEIAYDYSYAVADETPATAVDATGVILPIVDGLADGSTITVSVPQKVASTGDLGTLTATQVNTTGTTVTVSAVSGSTVTFAAVAGLPVMAASTVFYISGLNTPANDGFYRTNSISTATSIVATKLTAGAATIDGIGTAAVVRSGLVTFTVPASVTSRLIEGQVSITVNQAVDSVFDDALTQDGTLDATTPGTNAGLSGFINYDTGVGYLAFTTGGALSFASPNPYSAPRLSTTDVSTWSATITGAGPTTLATVAGHASTGSVNHTTGAISLTWTSAANKPIGATVTVDYTYNVNSSLSLYYQDGSDGLLASRVETFESLVRAYDSLEATDVDVLIPVEATLDAPNVADLTAGQVTSRSLDDALYTAIYTSREYPTKDSQQDVLGKVIVEEYNGSKYFFWNFDGSDKAQIVPQVFAIDSVEAGTQTIINSGEYSIAEALKEAATPASGTKLQSTSFKEVNFAWESAYFCYKLEVNDNSATCVIGTEAPLSYLPEDINTWIGVAPTLDYTGAVTVNGSGLIGNKFMVGTQTHGKGFWATDSGYLPTGALPSESADTLTDDNGKPIQIGKYLSVTANPVIQTSKADVFGVGTTVSLHTLYGGSYGGVAEDYAMTYKSIPGVQLPFNITKLQAEKLADARYVAMINNRLGTVIVEDALATTSTSDFQNLSTIRIVTQLTEDVRDELAQYIGQGLNDAKLAAANTTIVSILNAYQKAGKIVTGNGKAYASKRDRILGIMRVALNVTPAFQIKTIPISISLTAPTA